MPVSVEVEGLSELIGRMDAYPKQIQDGMSEAMQDTLLVVNENVPSYAEKPATSSYDRTGTLGRTLGSSIEGGKRGSPDIYEVRALGSGVEGRFGTNLDYAPYVIGDKEQAWMHKGRWWVLSAVAERAQEKITRVWQMMADAMAKFLEGKG